MPGFMYLLLSVAALILGYHFYGRLVERVFQPDENRRPPALSMADGVDYTVETPRKVFLNQLLCIAGTGPVFGPILGVLYGPVALLWIVLGAIFAGAVHDYLSGMIAMRYRGESISNVAGYLYGPVFKQFMRFFSLGLLIMVGVIMAITPAGLLSSMTRMENDYSFWLILIFVYYFCATIMPIELLLERFNPFFTCILAAMALLVVGALLFGDYPLFQMAARPAPHPQGLPLWPLMFITIACGAVSGFHATQSTISARCLGNEMSGRRIFYGPMIVEGIIALVWATAGMTFYQTPADLQTVLSQGGPARVVRDICFDILGDMGGLLAVLGVVVLPITSGDTAFRSARLLVADMFNFSQKNILRRLLIAIPLFAVGVYISLSDKDFGRIWRYFAWLNQSLACFVLWSGAAYLVRLRRCHWLATLPATFMTAVVTSYILYEKIGLGLPYDFSVACGLGAAVFVLAFFLTRRGRILTRAPYELTPAGDRVDEDPRGAVQAPGA